MPRPRKPARLVLRRFPGGRTPTWYIVDGPKEVSTGCAEADLAGAEKRLAIYTGAKYDPAKNIGKGLKIPVVEVVNVYLREHAPTVDRIDFLEATCKPLSDWWLPYWLSDINKKTCVEYVDWRTQQTGKHKRLISVATARHDLKTLRAALNYFHATYGPLPSVPVVSLPPKPEPKDDWLTRSEVARLLWAARARAWADRRRFGDTRANEPYTANHVCRFILLGVYTGSRSGILLSLRWTPNDVSGHVDLAHDTIYRKPARSVQSRKRAPKLRIHQRLQFFLRKWRATDAALNQDVICHWQGAEVDRLEKSWDTACEAAGIGRRITPHILRHTCTTWLLQAGVPIWEVSGFVGMSEQTIRDVYGHHSPEWQQNAATATNKRPRRPTPKKDEDDGDTA